MPKTYLFHKSNPQGQSFELTEELAKTLEAEGWVDTPDKLNLGHRLNAGQSSGERVETQSGKSVPRETPVTVTESAGAALGNSNRSVAILASDEAKARIEVIVDADGVPMHATLSTEALGVVIDAMSRDEVVYVCQVVGIGETFDAPFTSQLRSSLIETLRPGEFGKQKTDVELNDGESTIDESVARGKAQGQETVPATPTDQDPGKAGDQPAKEGVAVVEDSGGGKPVEGGELTLEAATAMTEAQREEWLLHKDTDKAHLRAMLEAAGKTPKARDGKEEMQEAIRLHFAPEA